MTEAERRVETLCKGDTRRRSASKRFMAFNTATVPARYEQVPVKFGRRRRAERLSK
jgi:hypothetical protein